MSPAKKRRLCLTQTQRRGSSPTKSSPATRWMDSVARFISPEDLAADAERRAGDLEATLGEVKVVDHQNSNSNNNNNNSSSKNNYNEGSRVRCACSRHQYFSSVCRGKYGGPVLGRCGKAKQKDEFRSCLEKDSQVPTFPVYDVVVSGECPACGRENDPEKFGAEQRSLFEESRRALGLAKDEKTEAEEYIAEARAVFGRETRKKGDGDVRIGDGKVGPQEGREGKGEVMVVEEEQQQQQQEEEKEGEGEEEKEEEKEVRAGVERLSLGPEERPPKRRYRDLRSGSYAHDE